MVFINVCKEFFRDKMNLFFTIIFPLILILLLGNMLNSLNKADAEVGYIKTEYIIDSNQMVEQEMIGAFLTSLNDTGGIQMTKSKGMEISKEKITSGELDGFVVFKDDSIEINEGEEIIKNRTFTAIVNGFIQNKKAVLSIINSTDKKGVDKITVVTEQKSYTTKKSFDKNRSMLDYYGVSMIVLIICIGGIGGFSYFGDERKNRTMNRLIASPMNRTNIFIQKVMAMMLGSFIQIAVIMIVSVTLFQVRYASNLIDNALLFLLFFVTMIMIGCIGVSLGVFLKCNPTIVFLPVLWLMMFFGGTFSTEVYIEGLTPRLPVYKLQQAAFGLTIFGRKENVIIIILLELLATICVAVLGIFKFNKMQEER